EPASDEAAPETKEPASAESSAEAEEPASDEATPETREPASEGQGEQEAGESGPTEPEEKQPQ
ncbi:MAG TPA: cyclase, partial [Bacteroidetes bacterium]|nr:cyclase [Bacteroidota bacterium]